jgi:hypothetical protein
MNQSENITEIDKSFDPDTAFTRIFATSSQYNLPFRSFLDKLSLDNETQEDSLVSQLLSLKAAIPIIEADSIFHFLFWGKSDSVAIAGDATGWVPS